MEGEVTVDHIVPSEKCKILPMRNYSDETFCSESSDGNQSSRSKNNSLLQKRRKTLAAASGNPYRASASNFGARYIMINSNSKNNTIAQKVLSARMLRLKQLQNELNDAHFQINELATENRMLHTLQKRQDLALSRFEDKKAELPVLLNAHTEEVRVLRATIKQLRAQVREMEAKMKDRDTELSNLRESCSKLTQLCNDRKLEERDTLQKRVDDLAQRNEEQAETIKLLNRKIALESKNYDHRLNTETAHHRNTQRQLTKALEHAAQLQTTLKAKEKLIRSKIDTSTRHIQGSRIAGQLGSFAPSSADQIRFPELQTLHQSKQESEKGNKYFSEENSPRLGHNNRFSLIQEPPRPQTSESIIGQLQIRGTKKLNAHPSSFGLKQQKYRIHQQEHQIIQEDPDSDSQKTTVSSGAELFEEGEEQNTTTDELSRSSSFHPQKPDESKYMSSSISEEPLMSPSTLHSRKSSANSSEISGSRINSLGYVCDETQSIANTDDLKHSHFNKICQSPSRRHDGCSSEEEDNHRGSPLTETSYESEKATTKMPIMAESDEEQFNQNMQAEEKSLGTFRKDELLAALEAIDKGETVHENLTAKHADVDLDKAKNKTDLMRELFGSS